MSRCASCLSPIELDTPVCPSCGFRFGVDKPPIGIQLPAPQPRPRSRRDAGLLTAAGFTLAALLLSVTPLLYFALFFASPLTAVWSLIAGRDAAWPLPQEFLPLLFIGSFALLGAAVGYVFPFPRESFRKDAHAVAMRFAIAFIAMAVIGPLAFTASL